MMGHVWADVLRLGGYAWRLNLLSACFSAAGAGCFFLVAHRLLAADDSIRRIGGAAAGAVISGFTFTVWQNSNETEVYTVATFSIAAICWLCLRWRDTRGTTRAPHCLLLVMYIAALSIGNHLLALLVGPAVSLFIYVTLRAAPAPDPAERRVEWSEWAVVSALWIVLIGVGLGSTGLLVVGGILSVAALAACATAGSFFFPLAALSVAAVGVSTYAFLYIRSGLQPLLDEADPETWSNLLAVIRREQYGSRGLLDNPTFLPGPDNPGRSLTIFAQQFVNYGQYFVWQWGRGLGALAAIPAVLFSALGLLGFDDARRRDRGVAWLLGALWLVTGFGLVIYMNFKPGFSLFWNDYPKFDQHEVRERDYFFTVSFQVWGLLAGVGLARAAAEWRRLGRWAVAAAGAVALLPFALNVGTASRRGPDATAARDVAYNLLQSVEPYGVLFSYGDNDTFPVWYLQEVEGVRQDVTLINLSLASLDWYLRQLVSRPTRPFDPAGAPAVYRPLAPAVAPGPPFRLSVDEINQLGQLRVSEDRVFRADGLELPIRNGQILQVRDLVILYTLAASLPPPGRPVSFGVSSGRGAWLGLDPHLVLQGLAYRVFPGRPDTAKRFVPGIQGVMVDPPRTALLADSVFHYGGLLQADVERLDPAAQQVATSFSIPFIELGNAAALRRDREATLAYFRRALQLNPSPQLAEIIGRVEREGLEHLFRP
jgi:transmembrane protein TMEM260 (protein O-mannosyltransferase)